MTSEKIKAFVVAVGQDVKALRKALDSKEDKGQAQAGGVSEEQLNQAIKALKSELLGEGVSEDLDTIKELADKIASLDGDTSGALVAKLTELGQKVDELADTDYLAAYNEAKGS